MEIEKRKPSGREKDEASIKLLSRLREELHSQHASNRRQAAFNLSWMQEDGLEILQAALFSKAHVTTKNAATYGLRNMRGRMKKMALEVLKEGLEHGSRDTRDVCKSALLRLAGKTEKKPPSKSNARKSKYEIRDIPRGPRGNRQQRTVGMMRSRNRRGPIGNRRNSRD
ncbi:MAG: HEAT repeat domain-containing protein [Planctomycetota bacterium]|jgi:hypothetical protein